MSSRGSSEDRSVEREEKESPAKKAPAKKKRTRVLSSSSSGSSSGGDDGIVVTINSGDKFSGSSAAGVAAWAVWTKMLRTLLTPPFPG